MREKKQPTFVLFGKEAITMFKVSAERLIKTTDINYYVGAYTDVRAFVIEKNQRGPFVVINKKEYRKLSKNLSEPKATSRNNFGLVFNSLFN